MTIDHIFIFTNDGGKVANELVDFGLTEGSNRVHTGQGTTNRKFYFQNFFLEVLWVHDEEEIKKESLKPIGLWQRADYKTNNFSRYGLCIVNTDETNDLFKGAYKYQPDYFPNGNTIDILKNENNPSIPWTFRLPFEGQKRNESEPTNHVKGFSKLTKATFEITDENTAEFLKYFKSEQQCSFLKTHRSWLTLTFDYKCENKSWDFEKLGLTIEF